MSQTHAPEAEARSVHELGADECRRLLATQCLGRIAVSEPGSAPHVVPVNFVVYEGDIVFRTGDGTKFRLLQGQPVSFQVDCADPYHRIGWSVLVRGHASEVPAADIEPYVHVETFAPGDKPHWIRLVSEVITGRRIHLPVAPVFDPRGYL
jgi:nitroimidazol reductase NimA-like FMN-containing flavoprotein (pyridoxamine 5'-phosphate oxidase superfamily)